MIICVTLLKKEKRKERERERKAKGSQNFKRKPHALHIISTLPDPASFLLALQVYYTTARPTEPRQIKPVSLTSPHLNILSLSLSLYTYSNTDSLSIYLFLCYKTLFSIHCSVPMPITTLYIDSSFPFLPL